MGWGREFMHPDEVASEDGVDGWLSREEIPDIDEATRAAAAELAVPAECLRLTPVLMREQSEVEARIHGHEAPYWVECTKRARHPERMWRVETTRPERG